jgi:NPCBM/NEW2 domain
VIDCTTIIYQKGRRDAIIIFILLSFPLFVLSDCCRPAVAFYSSDRAVSLVSVEADLGKFGGGKTGAGSSGSSNLAIPSSLSGSGSLDRNPLTGSNVGYVSSCYLTQSLVEHHSSVLKGTSLGKNGDLGYDWKEVQKKQQRQQQQRRGGGGGRRRGRRGSSSAAPAAATSGAEAEEEEDEDEPEGHGDNGSEHSSGDDSGSDSEDGGSGGGADARRAKKAKEALERRKVKVAAASSSTSYSLSMHPPAALAVPAAPATAAAGAAEPASVSAAAADADESPDARRERLLQEASRQTKAKPSASTTTSAFAGTATAVYWLGKRYESFSGSCALNDSATPDLRPASSSSSSDGNNSSTAGGSSPIFFEVYGDGKLLWRSEPIHASKTPPQPFATRVLGVEVLRLVVRCLGGNAGAHAVWLDPRLTMVTEWCHNGWRNDRETFEDELSGLKRGKIAPLPAPEEVLGLSSPADATSLLSTSNQGLALALLAYSGLLAQEHLKGLGRRRRSDNKKAGNKASKTGAAGQDDTSTVATAGASDASSSSDSSSNDGDEAATASSFAPFVLQPLVATGSSSSSSLQLVSDLLTALLQKQQQSSSSTATLPDSAVIAAITGLIRLLHANLKNNSELLLTTAAAGATASSAAAPSLLSSIATQLYSLAKWGGGGSTGADEKPLLSSATATAATASSSPLLVQECVWEFLGLAESLMIPLDEKALLLATTAGGSSSKDSKDIAAALAASKQKHRLLRAVAGGPGVIELQLQWPCDEGDNDGAFVQLETLLLQTQLWSAENKARCKLFGKWPARVYLVLEVTAAGGVKEWLDGPFTSMLASLDLKNWWWASASDSTTSEGSSNAGPSAATTAAEGSEIFPVKLERDPLWDRKARGVVEGGIGAIRVYPSFITTAATGGSTTTFDKVCEGLEKFLPKEA